MKSDDDDNVDAFIAEIEEMFGDPRYEWARKTLDPIYDWTVGNRRFTPNMKQAIKNIRERVEGTSEKKTWKRRYEGHL